MARPTLRAQVAFDTDPLDTPTWTTIHEGDDPARVLDVQVKTGRGFELDAFQPGQMTLGLDNSDRAFDPLHAAGPHYGDLLPRKRCRLQADWGSYLNCTGASTSGAFTLDSAGFDITGDIDIRARIAADDWTPAGTEVIVGKANLSGEYSYALALNTSGTLLLAWSTAGSLASILNASSSSPVGAANGDTRWVRATLDVDDGGGNRVIRFYTSTDETHDHTAVSWTQLGSTVTTAGTTSIHSGSAVPTIGVLADGASPFTGKVYAAAVLDGIDGTAASAPDFTDGNLFVPGAASGTGPSGNVWTISSPASLEPVTYDLFSGFVDAWPQDFGRFQASAQMTATDGFKVLSRIDLSGAYEETVRGDGPVGWWRLGDDTADSDLCADSSGNGHDGRYVNQPTSTDSIVDGTADGAVDFDGANDKLDLPPTPFGTGPLESIPVSYEFWLQTSMVPSGSSPGAVLLHGTLPDDPASFVESFRFWLRADGTVRFGAAAPGSVTSTVAVNDGAPHHIVGTFAASTVDLYIDGVLAATVGHGDVYVLGVERVRAGAPRVNVSGYKKFDGVLDEIAVYRPGLTADQVAAHFDAGAAPWSGDTTGERVDRALTLAGWPTADRDLDTGRSLMGAYQGDENNILAVVQEAEVTEGGALWQAPDGTITFRDRHAPIQDWNATTTQATFTDDGAATGPQHYTVLDLSYDDALIVNEVEVAWSDGTETSRDQASIDDYTRQATRIDTALRTAPEARDRGDWLLARYAQPAVRPTRVVLRPAADDRLWRHCLARRIGDRVTVRRLPQNTGDPIVFDATIESVAHRVADGINTWETEFGLSPTAVDLGWLILDDPTDGLLDTGRLAF